MVIYARVINLQGCVYAIGNETHGSEANGSEAEPAAESRSKRARKQRNPQAMESSSSGFFKQRILQV